MHCTGSYAQNVHCLRYTIPLRYSTLHTESPPHDHTNLDRSRLSQAIQQTGRPDNADRHTLAPRLLMTRRALPLPTPPGLARAPVEPGSGSRRTDRLRRRAGGPDPRIRIQPKPQLGAGRPDRHRPCWLDINAFMDQPHSSASSPCYQPWTTLGNDHRQVPYLSTPGLTSFCLIGNEPAPGPPTTRHPKDLRQTVPGACGATVLDLTIPPTAARVDQWRADRPQIDVTRWHLGSSGLMAGCSAMV